MTDSRNTQIQGGDPEDVCGKAFHEICSFINLRGKESLSPAQLTVYCVEVFFGQMSSGGLQSFLSGPYEWVVPRTCTALLRVGLPEYSKFLQGILEQIFPSGIPDDEGAYRSRIESIYDDFSQSALRDAYQDPFDPYDDAFSELYSDFPCSFRERLRVYIHANGREFAYLVADHRHAPPSDQASPPPVRDGG